MKDTFGRTITYLRVSVTDRCDLRCHYCMAEEMTFLPRPELLSFEELDRCISAFVRRGVNKIRITGGEPLVRHGVMELFRALSRHLKTGAMRELTLTSNGTQLAKYADELAACGVKRINISLDSLDPDKFKQITRVGKLDKVLTGIRAAKEAGLRVKINTVALRGQNDAEIPDLIQYCIDNDFDITFIETMPLGDIGGERCEQYLPLDEVRRDLEKRWTLTDSSYSSGGPARFTTIDGTTSKIGFITPLTHGFCETCNRMRLTCTGKLYMCLGQNDHVDLRSPIRTSEGDLALESAIDEALHFKPKGHEFVIDPNDTTPALKRHMNVTGG